MAGILLLWDDGQAYSREVDKKSLFHSMPLCSGIKNFEWHLSLFYVSRYE